MPDITRFEKDRSEGDNGKTCDSENDKIQT